MIIKTLGLCDYTEVWQAMKDFTENRDANTLDEIWLLEHFPVFTQGLAGKPEHVLNARDIPIVQTDRGGQITYHGPGQLIGYVLFDLKRAKIGVKAFVNSLENAVMQLLDDYDIKANADPHAPGVYVDCAKICSIGLRIRRGCSYHGIALNVNNELEPFSRINPCGFKGLRMTKMSDLVDHKNSRFPVTLDVVGKIFAEKLEKILNANRSL
jgi:lipoyl(octanoyl) transferase